MVADRQDLRSEAENSLTCSLAAHCRVHENENGPPFASGVLVFLVMEGFVQ